MNQNDAAIMDVLYVVERGTDAFEAARTAVDIVCAGDRLTGWNNFGPAEQWPYRTYPDFLQERCVPLGLQVANGGIAGEISDNGPQQVRDYLDLFPNARYFIIGMGTNDLGTWPDTEAVSKPGVEHMGSSSQATAVNSSPLRVQRMRLPVVWVAAAQKAGVIAMPVADTVFRRNSRRFMLSTLLLFMRHLLRPEDGRGRR